MRCSHVMSRCVKVPYKRMTKRKNKNLFYYYVLMCIVVGLCGTLWCGCTASILNQALYLSQNHLFLRTPGKNIWTVFIPAITSQKPLVMSWGTCWVFPVALVGWVSLTQLNYPLYDFITLFQSLLLLLILFLIKMTQYLLSFSHIRQQPRGKVILPG